MITGAPAPLVTMENNVVWDRSRLDPATLLTLPPHWHLLFGGDVTVGDLDAALAALIADWASIGPEGPAATARWPAMSLARPNDTV